MIVRDAQWYAALPYAIQIVPDVTTEGEECYVAKHPELSGCMAHGGSATEALENLREARLLFLQTLLDDGIAPPIPIAVERGHPASVAILTIVQSVPTPNAATQTLPSMHAHQIADEAVTA